MARKLIPVTEKETSELVRKCGTVQLAFGTGGAALVWNDGEPMPTAVFHLGLMRGVLNQNMDGAGI